MKITPKTAEEIQTASLLPDGEYDFEVLDAKDQLSKKQNEMIAVKLNVFDPAGGSRHVYDYLLDAMAFKILHFCEGTGLKEKYAAGQLMAADTIGKAGRVKIVIKSAEGSYAAKNEVKDYVVKEATPAAESDDIDF